MTEYKRICESLVKPEFKTEKLSSCIQAGEVVVLDTALFMSLTSADQFTCACNQPQIGSVPC